MIHLKFALGESSADPLDPQKDAPVCQSKQTKSGTPLEAKGQDEAVLLLTHCDKAGFSGKEKNAGKMGGRGETKAKRETD